MGIYNFILLGLPQAQEGRGLSAFTSSELRTGKGIPSSPVSQENPGIRSLHPSSLHKPVFQCHPSTGSGAQTPVVCPAGESNISSWCYPGFSAGFWGSGAPGWAVLIEMCLIRCDLIELEDRHSACLSQKGSRRSRAHTPQVKKGGGTGIGLLSSCHRAASRGAGDFPGLIHSWNATALCLRGEALIAGGSDVTKRLKTLKPQLMTTNELRWKHFFSA